MCDQHGFSWFRYNAPPGLDYRQGRGVPASGKFTSCSPVLCAGYTRESIAGNLPYALFSPFPGYHSGVHSSASTRDLAVILAHGAGEERQGGVQRPRG